MAQTLKFGNKVWAAKEESVLAYNDINNNYKPLPFFFKRTSIGTRVNKDGLIETMGQDIARIDYSDSADGVLLLEPQRTNVLLQSNQFDTTWTNSNASVTSGQSGIYNTTDAWKLEATGGSGSQHIVQSIVTSGSSTYSIYVKAGTTDWVALRVTGSPTSYLVWFDLTNGLVGENQNAIKTSIKLVGNGWYHCCIEINSTTDNVFVYLATGSGLANLNTTVGDNIYIQNAQLEAGSYPTSYIPTSGSSVTRATETCNNSGNSEVFNDSEGVLFADIAALVNDNNFKAISVSDSSTSDRITLSLYQSSLYAYIAAGGVGQFNVSQAVNSIFQYHKIAIKYKTNNCAFWVNGFEVATDISATMPSGLIELAFDKGDGNDDLYGKTKELGYYDTALTDLELETLTSYRNWVSMVNELNLNIIYNG